MSKETLSALIAGLRSQLAQANDLDAGTREALQGLAREMESALEQPAPGAAGAEQPLAGRLSDRLRELEVSHPKLAATIGNLVDTLAFYGL